MTAPKRGARARRPGTRKTRGPLLPILAGGAVVVLAALGAITMAGDDDDQPAREAAPATGVTVSGGSLSAFSGASPDAAAGTVAPALEGTDFDGKTVRIGPDGTPKVVMFLAHWCPHCQREVPKVQDWLDEQGPPEGVALYSVSTSVAADRPNHPPERWFEREGWTVPVIRDEGSKAAEAFGLTGFPYFVFLDGENRVVQRASGEMDIDDLEAIIQRLRDGQD